MRYRPTFEEFTELAQNSSLVPVYRQLVGDTLTPVSAFCKIQEGEWAFLFESVVGGERLGRYANGQRNLQGWCCRHRGRWKSP